MKYTLLLAIWLFHSNVVHAQSDQLPQSVINDYAYNLYSSYKYNDDVKATMYHMLRRIDPRLSMIDIEVGMESLVSDKNFREATFKVWTDRYGTNRDLLIAQFTGLGMSARNASILIEYIVKPIEKRRAEERKQREIEAEKQRIRDEAEDKRREQERQRLIAKENRLREKTYNLNEQHNSFNIESFKQLLLSNLEQQLISKKGLTNEITIEDHYNYFYRDIPSKINSGTGKLTPMNNSKNILPIVSNALPRPLFEVEGIQVPVEIAIDSIKIHYYRGVTEVKMKNNKVSFKKPVPNKIIQQALTKALKGKPNGRYTVPYALGTIDQHEFGTIEIPEKQEKKKNYTGTLIGLGVVVAALIFGS